MSDKPRFTDNGDETITDHKTQLTWCREDSWQTEQKWYTWDEALNFVHRLNNLKFCGHMDWRLPTVKETQTLYDPEKVIPSKYEKDLHLDPIFPPGPLGTIWLEGRGSGNEGNIFDFHNGEVRPLFKSKSGRMSTRVLRGEFKEL